MLLFSHPAYKIAEKPAICCNRLLQDVNAAALKQADRGASCVSASATDWQKLRPAHDAGWPYEWGARGQLCQTVGRSRRPVQ